MKLKLIILFIFVFVNSLCLKAQNVSAEVEFKTLLSQSYLYFNKGEDDKAISSLNQCLKLNSKSSVANFLLSRIYASRRDFNAAINYASKAYKLNSDNKFYAQLLGHLYYTVGDFNNSLKYFENYYMTNPSYENYIQFYDLCVDMKNHHKKIELMTKIIELYGYTPEFGYFLANDYWAANDIKNADVEFKRLFRTDTSNLLYLQGAKNFYSSIRKQSETQRIQNWIMQISSSNVSGQVADNDIYLSSGKMDLFYENLVESCRNDMSVTPKEICRYLLNFVEKYLDAEIFSKDSVDLAYRVLCETYPYNSDVYRSYSSCKILFNEVSSSLDIIKEFLQHNKSDFNFYSKLFRVALIYEFDQDLLDYSEEALELYPDVAEVYLYHAISQIRLGEYQNAYDDLEMAKELGIYGSKYFSDYIFYLGVYNYFTGNQSLALEYFNRYETLKVDFYFFDLQLAYFLIDSDANLKHAQSIINHYTNYKHLPYYFYFVRAYYNLKVNNLAQSREDILEAIKMDSSRYYVYNLAGDIFAASGDCYNAITYWNQAIDRGGKASLISNKIQKCK